MSQADSFFVGDPKQSIYRFRRADIATFLRTRSFVADGPDGAIETLTTNFRCTEPIIRWVNTVFGNLIKPTEGSQPEYTPLIPWRTAAINGPGVTVLGTEPVEPSEGQLNSATLRRIEAETVASSISHMFKQEWDVLNEDAQDSGSSGGSGANVWRPVRFSDIAVLIPDRNSLAALEDALENTGIPYRAETSSLVYGTRDVRDVLVALQAIADPTDELALVAALRSPIYGCGDDDLAHWKLGVGGRFSLIAHLSDDTPENHPVAEAITHLHGLLDAKRWASPSMLMDRLIRERGVYETAVVSRRPRDVWRRLRFLVDQARAWSDAGGTDLRSYLAWARLQGAEKSRVTETILPETDDDSVRILTVHGSKGLEFPIAVISGMTSRLSRSSRGLLWFFLLVSHLQYGFKKGVHTRGYEAHRTNDQKMDIDESLRLLYVACSRARDHLVVSLFRRATERTVSRKSNAYSTYTTYAEALFDSGAADVRNVNCYEVNCYEDDGDDYDGGFAPDRTRTKDQQDRLDCDSAADCGESDASPSREEWKAELSLCLNKAKRPAVISPTLLATPDLSQTQTSHDSTLWNQGRYGKAVGEAVHVVLQVIDLATGEGLENEARRQAAAKGVNRHAKAVIELARSALGTKTVRQATASQYWREVHVVAPVSDSCDTLVEGYIDLMYRDVDGLVVVDWKTDAVKSADDIDAKLARYRLQGAAYAAVVETITGETVARMEFVFLSRDTEPAIAEIDDLRTAINEVKTKVLELSLGLTVG